MENNFFIFLIFTNCTFYWPFLIADFDLAPCFSLWHLCAVSLWYLLIFLLKHPSYRRQYCVPALEELRSNNWDTPSGFTAKETNERRLWLTDGEARWQRGSVISIALRRNWIKKKKKEGLGSEWVYSRLPPHLKTCSVNFQSVALNAALTSHWEDGHPWCSTADGHGSSGVPDTQDILDSWSAEV